MHLERVKGKKCVGEIPSKEEMQKGKEKKAKRKKRDKFSKVVVRREGVSQSGRMDWTVSASASCCCCCCCC